MGLGDLTALWALLAGAVGGAGLLLLVVAVLGRPARPDHARPVQAGLTGSGLTGSGLAEAGPAGRPPASRRIGELLRLLSRRGAVAVLAGLVVLVVSRWPVAAIASGFLVFSWSALFGGATSERLGMQRVEALASWTESLRDTIAGAVGLEQAIPVSVRAAAPVLQPHLRVMIDRLRTRMPLPEALVRFADELDDPSADLIIAALILNAKLRGPGLREVLGALATSARDEVQMRHRVMAERRSTRRSVQIVVAVTLLAVFALVVFNRSYVEPYGTPQGQLVLLVVIALFAAGFFWLRKLAEFTSPSRFLTSGSSSQPAPRHPGAGA